MPPEFKIGLTPLYPVYGMMPLWNGWRSPRVCIAGGAMRWCRLRTAAGGAMLSAGLASIHMSMVNPSLEASRAAKILIDFDVLSRRFEWWWGGG